MNDDRDILAAIEELPDGWELTQGPDGTYQAHGVFRPADFGNVFYRGSPFILHVDRATYDALITPWPDETQLQGLLAKV